jgi:hypothetical protein
VTLLTEYRVLDIARSDQGFVVSTSRGEIRARFVVLATGGLSLPRTGSDGAGYDFARSFGHSIVPTTPALVPLVLADGDEAGLHRDLSGVSHDAALEVWVNGSPDYTAIGSLLWTHFGVSGPVTLDASRHWLRARLLNQDVRLVARLSPGHSFDDLDRTWTAAAAARGRSSVQRSLATLVPAAVAAALLANLNLNGANALADLRRADRRRLVHALTGWSLPVRDSRGYSYAEVTAGGIALTEIDPGSMESRVCPGLFLVGEILDVDGRIGGFNFQWAWATGWIAGAALAGDP